MSNTHASKPMASISSSGGVAPFAAAAQKFKDSVNRGALWAALKKSLLPLGEDITRTQAHALVDLFFTE